MNNFPSLLQSAEDQRRQDLDDVERHGAAESYSDWLRDREREALDNLCEGGVEELKRIAGGL